MLIFFVFQVCTTLGNALFDDIRQHLQGFGDNTIKAVEFTQMWPFGLNHKEKFVLTRGDAVSTGKDDRTLYIIHEHKSKWSPRNRDYQNRILPRDAKQCFLNACILAMTTSVSRPLKKIQATCRYVTPTIFKQSGVQANPSLYRHTFSLSANSNVGFNGMVVRSNIEPVRSSMLQVLSGMSKYVDPQFICEDPLWYTRLASNVKRISPNTTRDIRGPITRDDPLLRYTAAVRISCMGLSQIHHHDLIRGSPFFNKNKTDRNTLDKGWWYSNYNDGKGCRLKRAQMGQRWRTNKGVPIFNNPNQTSSNRAFGGAPTSRPPPGTDNINTVSVEGGNSLANKVYDLVNNLEDKKKVRLTSVLACTSTSHIIQFPPSPILLLL